MKKLILASNNAKKVKEIKEILKGLPIEVRSLKDEGIDIDVVEDGKTFEENAKKKAKEIYEFLLAKGKKDFIVLADDSGLEVDYLNGEPGINSNIKNSINKIANNVAIDIAILLSRYFFIHNRSL